MGKKLKSKEFHLSIGVLFRWIFFALFIYFSISFLSGNKSSYKTNSNLNLKVLGISSEPIIKEATKTFENYKNQFIKFAGDQIVDIKKGVITKVYEEIIKNIDNNKQ